MVGFWKMMPIERRTSRGCAIEVEAVDRHGAARLGQRRGQNRDRGRLARAVRTKEGEELALAHVEADVVDGVDVGLLVSLNKVLDFDNILHGIRLSIGRV